MTTIVLVDDHPIVREGIRNLMAAHPTYSVVGETGLGLVAVQLVETLRPDVAIVDLMLPDLNGLEVTRRMIHASSHTRVAILSMYSDEPHVLEALRAGAMAYIIKGADAETIHFALSELMAGRRYLTPPLSDRVVEVYATHQAARTEPVDRYQLLTAREREVLELLARGASYADIADKMTISPRTAETHRTTIMRKLDLKATADITLYAIQRGLIDPEHE